MNKIREIRREVMAKIEEDLVSYERASEHYLLRNMPIIVRIDGKNFKHITRGLDKPFDERFNNVMRDTLISLCRTVKGVVMGYTISDEIDLLIYDNDIYWYDLNLQGLVASIASLATGIFNRYYQEQIIFSDNNKRIGLFDVVAFNVPQEHVSDYFIRKQKFEMRANLEKVCELNGVTKDLKTLSSFELKKRLFNLRAFDYDEKIDSVNRIGMVATMNEANDYIVNKVTPIFEEQPTFISSLVDIPLFDIDLEED